MFMCGALTVRLGLVAVQRDLFLFGLVFSAKVRKGHSLFAVVAMWLAGVLPDMLMKGHLVVAASTDGVLRVLAICAIC